MLPADSSVLALDVGERRIGVAMASAMARLAKPLTTLEHNDTILQSLLDLIREHGIAALVIGLPRNARDRPTAQTAAIQAFVASLTSQIHVPIYWQDEAFTSQKAETELQTRRKPYAKGDVDALAAAFILEDFLLDHPEIRA